MAGLANTSRQSDAIFEPASVEGAGVRLWWGRARVPDEAVRGEVLLTHGMGEHGSRYEHVAARLAQAGLRLSVYDLRGHGRSGGRRGDARRFSLFLEDLERVRARVEQPGRPLFLMGHSFGGLVTLCYLLEGRGECRGAVVASPWLRLAFSPRWWRLWLGRVAMRVWPGYTQGRPVEVENLSRDLPFLRSLAAPELVHHRISARLFFAIGQQGGWALREAGRLRTPLLLLHGGADRVTSPAATREFFAAAGSRDKALREYPEGRHETHNDLERERVLGEVAGWMGGRI